MPTFGLALSITIVSTYLPKVARQFTSSTTVIGLIVGAEGLMALWLPLVVGTWSDSVRTRLGGRLPFMLVGLPVVAIALILMGVVSSLLALALVAGIFFIGYFTTYAPYRALYPDLLGAEVSGRGQSTQALFRGAGTFLALVGGGLLLAIARPLPFVVAAGALVLATAAFISLALGGGLAAQEASPGHGIRRATQELWRLLAEQPALRAFMVANALWELSLAALKTFVVLYITEGLGHSLSSASLIIGAGALVVLIAALISGKLADRLGKPRVMYVALVIYESRPAAPVPHPGAGGADRHAADRRPRRRRDHDAALRAADPADARRRARSAHRVLQPHSRTGDDARAADQDSRSSCCVSPWRGPAATRRCGWCAARRFWPASRSPTGCCANRVTALADVVVERVLSHWPPGSSGPTPRRSYGPPSRGEV